jgi:hypothetical protein
VTVSRKSGDLVLQAWLQAGHSAGCVGQRSGCCFGKASGARKDGVVSVVLVEDGGDRLVGWFSFASLGLINY